MYKLQISDYSYTHDAILKMLRKFLITSTSIFFDSSNLAIITYPSSNSYEYEHESHLSLPETAEA